MKPNKNLAQNLTESPDNQIYMIQTKDRKFVLCENGEFRRPGFSPVKEFDTLRDACDVFKNLAFARLLEIVSY